MRHLRGKPLDERFWFRVDKSDECWLWTGSLNHNGYGSIGVDGPKTSLAHRVSWELHFGPIPDGLFVCHHCDHPSCVRPTHLFLGTPSDNQRDSGAKGRHWSQKYPGAISGDRNPSRRFPERLRRGQDNWAAQHPENVRGTRNAMAKLTDEQVLAIRTRRALGEPLRSLAAAFNVCQATISMIANRERWAHL